jgi:hypothetical protein
VESTGELFQCIDYHEIIKTSKPMKSTQNIKIYIFHEKVTEAIKFTVFKVIEELISIELFHFSLRFHLPGAQPQDETASRCQCGAQRPVCK